MAAGQPGHRQPARLGHSAQGLTVLLCRARRARRPAHLAEGAWWILEYLPKSATYKEWPARKVHFGYYIPDAEPRFIPDGAIIHESALQRMDAMPSYRPVNLPKHFEKFPMPVAPAHASAEAEEEA